MEHYITCRLPSFSCVLALLSQKAAWVTFGRSAKPGARGTEAAPAGTCINVALNAKDLPFALHICAVFPACIPWAREVSAKAQGNPN